MVAATQIPVTPEFEQRVHGNLIGSRGLGSVSSQLARWRIVLSAKRANHPKLRVSHALRNTLGKDAHNFSILPRTLVSADNVVIQRGFKLPSLRLGEVCDVLATVKALLFAGNR